MKRSWIAAAVAVLSLAVGVVARAQVAATPYVFVTVDAASSYATRLRVTGILQGEATAREIFVTFSSTDAAVRLDTCERKALLAMAKPGQYLFELTWPSSFAAEPTCKLTRANP